MINLNEEQNLDNKNESEVYNDTIPDEKNDKIINIIDKNKIYNEKIFFLEFLNFLEIYIHNLLYLKNVYPAEAFYQYKNYDLDLKYIVDDEINEYISLFLKNIEKLLFEKFIKKIYILIIDADTNIIIEVFNLELDFAKMFYEFNYSELCLNFKSILYKLKLNLGNTKDVNYDINKTFSLCVETNESHIFTNPKLYEETLNCIESNFIKNLFKNDLLKLYQKRQVYVIFDDLYFSVNISSNFL